MAGSGNLLLVFLALDLVYVGSAVAHLLVSVLTSESLEHPPTVNNVATNILLDHCPLIVAVVNAGIMMSGFLLSLPVFFRPRSQIYLHLLTVVIILSAVVTLVVGLDIWFSTLQTHKHLEAIWDASSPITQSMLQFKFQCCGYSNPALFLQDQTCPTGDIAAQLGPCITPFGVFANQFLDVVFTTFFGFVAVDVMFLLATLCVIKDRKEKARYKLIDEKSGVNAI